MILKTPWDIYKVFEDGPELQRIWMHNCFRFQHSLTEVGGEMYSFKLTSTQRDRIAKVVKRNRKRLLGLVYKIVSKYSLQIIKERNTT